MAKQHGRPSLFIPEITERIISSLLQGMPIADACRLAGVSEGSYYRWCAIARAIQDNIPHKGKPLKKDVDKREAFLEFLNTVKRAQAASRFRAVQDIVQAGRNFWKHRKTGQIVYSQPSPISWLHKQTGEVTFDTPIHPAQYEMEWSGESWQYVSGQWQAHAWYLERHDRQNWGRKLSIDVRHLDRLKDAADKAGVSLDELFEDLIEEMTQG